jgi:hypothetical protein
MLGVVEGFGNREKTVGALVSPDDPEKILGPVGGLNDDEK